MKTGMSEILRGDKTVERERIQISVYEECGTAPCATLGGEHDKTRCSKQSNFGNTEERWWKRL